MASKKNKRILVPEAEGRMHELRYQIAKRLGYVVVNSDDWWKELSPKQKSEVNGQVTKMMVEKVKEDMRTGVFKHY